MGEIAGTCLQSTLIILLPFLGCRMLISLLSSYWNLYMICLKFRTNHTKWSEHNLPHPLKRKNSAESLSLYRVLNHSKEGQVCEIYVGVNPRANSEKLFWADPPPVSFQETRQFWQICNVCITAICRWSWDNRRAAYPSGHRGRHHPPFVNWLILNWLTENCNFQGTTGMYHL